MTKGIIKYGTVLLIISLFMACSGKTATQRLAEENARINRYVSDSGYLITTVLPDSTDSWTDTIDGVAHDIYFKTSTGLLYHETKKGVGQSPTYTSAGASVVSVYYELSTLESDSILDDNMRSAPLEFTVGGSTVIQGMSQAVLLMREGGSCRTIMPSSLAYGSYGSGGVIAPYQTLVYKIDLVDVR